MDSFEELGLPPELVEALAAEGIERPTPLQKDVIPLLRRGNNALVRAGPGSGTLVAYGAPLLERVEAEGVAPRALALTATATAAAGLATSLARLAVTTGHSVAALGSPWAAPERSDILFGTASDLLVAVRSSRLRLEELRALVVDGAAAIQQHGGVEDLETLIAFLPATAQRVVVSLPVTPRVEAFARANVRKAGYVPGPGLASGEEAGPVRGIVRYRICRRTDAEIVRTVAGMLDEGARHALVFCASDDHAADIGDMLSLHGFPAGAPGDPGTPVWLAGRDDGAQPPLLEGMDDAGGVATLSVDAPAGADALRRRHGLGGEAAVLVLNRELAHLRTVAKEAGYRLRPLPPPTRTPTSDQLERRRAELLRILEEDDLASEMLLLDPLLERYDAVEVAAAATRLAGRAMKAPAAQRARAGAQAPADAGRSAGRTGAVQLPIRAQAWVRLFMSVGSRDGIGPRDLLRAAMEEAGVERAQVGRIEIQETFTRVEIHQQVAENVIRALNGTTLGGRSVRVDYHREPARRSGSGGGRRRRVRPAS